MGIRRRKHRPAARPLDASWIESDNAKVLQRSSAGAMDDRSTLSQKDTNAKQGTTGRPEAQQLEVPDASQDNSANPHSLAPSQSSEGLGPSASVSANDDASFQSQQDLETARSRDPRPGRARKRRYATKHHSHWLEEGGQVNFHNTQLQKHQPQAESGRPQPQADFCHLGGASTQQQAQHQHWGAAADMVNVPQALSTKSPSIFHPVLYDTNQGYDAPPVTPKVYPNYSPFAE